MAVEVVVIVIKVLVVVVVVIVVRNCYPGQLLLKVWDEHMYFTGGEITFLRSGMDVVFPFF
jgi:hypothetical protein